MFKRQNSSEWLQSRWQSASRKPIIKDSQIWYWFVVDFRSPNAKLCKHLQLTSSSWSDLIRETAGGRCLLKDNGALVIIRTSNKYIMHSSIISIVVTTPFHIALYSKTPTLKWNTLFDNQLDVKFLSINSKPKLSTSWLKIVFLKHCFYLNCLVYV